MLTETQKADIREQVGLLSYKANMLKSLRVDFTVTGRVAGYFRPESFSVDFNQQLAAENWDTFKETVIHEVAHAVDFYRNKMQWRKDKAGRRRLHDNVHKSIMRELGSEAPTTHHSYKVTYKNGNFEYACACKTRNLSIIRHRKVLKGAKYRCKSCKTELTYVGEKNG